MQIDFEHIIRNSGEILTKADLAREMVKEGIFKNKTSAYNMMQYHQRGEAKSIDFELLKYLMKRFNLTASQIIKR
jgi:hypothetical protein